ncbi:hypothetical protein [Microbispora bryophytorum]|uniref:hypothetical protein n=1 Tax=Microbispora bryophytorum TaxID=1460882 RepID=UPI0033F80A55
MVRLPAFLADQLQAVGAGLLHQLGHQFPIRGLRLLVAAQRPAGRVLPDVAVAAHLT